MGLATAVSGGRLRSIWCLDYKLYSGQTKQNAIKRNPASKSSQGMDAFDRIDSRA